MYALYKYTPDNAVVLAVSENHKKLTAKLREDVAEYALTICGYDEVEAEELYGDYKEAVTSYEDIDCDYFVKWQIQNVGDPL